MINEYRVRYAPSPTGYLHIGNARTALFNFLLAKHYDGKFIIRVEDTDIKRNIDDALKEQFDSLKWLGIIEDESIMNPGRLGPYKQLERLNIYKYYAKQLIDQKHAFYCFCTSEQLEKEREYQKSKNIKSPKYSGTCSKLSHNEIEILKNEKPYTIRFKVKSNAIHKYNDIIRGEIEFQSNDIGDFIIIKKDGIPTYNFAVVIDDHLMQISHVLRGEEHISNTPKQLMIYEAFNWSIPIFGHLTLIVNEERKKLSKRDYNVITFIKQYRDLGYLPEAVFNFIALLGWSPKSEEEFFTKEKLIKIFDETGFSKSPGMFDVKKLNWMNAKFIKLMSDDDYYSFCFKFLKKKFNLNDKSKKWISEFINLYKNELQYGEQINHFAAIFLSDNYVFDKKFKELFLENKYDLNFAKYIFNGFLSIKEWSINDINNLIKNISTKYKITGKNLFMPIRLLTTNSDHGPSISKCIYLLGQEKIIKNIKYILNAY